MSNSFSMSLGWNVNGGRRTSASISDTNNGVVQINELAVTAPVTNREYDVAIPFESVSSVVIYCTVDANLKTNSSGSPDDEMTLLAGVPVYGTQNAKAFTVDVTKLFLSVAGSDPFDFIVDCLLDTTP